MVAYDIFSLTHCLLLESNLSTGRLKFMSRDYRLEAVWKLEPYIVCVESHTGDE